MLSSLGCWLKIFLYLPAHWEKPAEGVSHKQKLGVRGIKRFFKFPCVCVGVCVCFSGQLYSFHNTHIPHPCCLLILLCNPDRHHPPLVPLCASRDIYFCVSPVFCLFYIHTYVSPRQMPTTSITAKVNRALTWSCQR
jgi:hypothetical protein